MNMSTNEKIIYEIPNRGNFKLSIVAKFIGTGPVQYAIRVFNPNPEPNAKEFDYVSTLDGFKRIGELLLDLHQFAQEKLYATDIEKVKELLTPENIKTFVELRKSATFKE
jgi:hypothetical protein